MRLFLVSILLLPSLARAHWFDDYLRETACESAFVEGSRHRVHLSPRLRADLAVMFKTSSDLKTAVYADRRGPALADEFAGRDVTNLGVLGWGNEGVVFAVRIDSVVRSLKVLKPVRRGPSYVAGDLHGDLRVLEVDGLALLMEFVPGVLIEDLRSRARIRELGIPPARARVLFEWFGPRLPHRMMDYAIDVRGGDVFELDAQ